MKSWPIQEGRRVGKWVEDRHGWIWNGHRASALVLFRSHGCLSLKILDRGVLRFDRIDGSSILCLDTTIEEGKALGPNEYFLIQNGDGELRLVI